VSAEILRPVKKETEEKEENAKDNEEEKKLEHGQEH